MQSINRQDFSRGPGLADGDDFRVSGGIAIQFAAVAAATDDFLGGLMHDHATDRNITGRPGGLGFGDRFAHPLLGIHCDQA